MSDATKTRGDNTAGNSECPTPSGSQSSSRTRRFLTKAERKIDKGANAFKRLVGLKEKGAAGGQEAGSGGGGTGSAAAAASAGLGTATPQGETGQEFVTSGSLALGVVQEATQDSPAAPPSTLGQPEDDSVPLMTGGAIEPLTMTITAPTPGLSGEEVASDSIEGVRALSPPPASQASEGAAVTSPSASSSRTWPIVAGALKKTLSGAVSIIPDPFKSPAEVLLKIIDVFEEANQKIDQVLQRFWLENLITGALVLSDVRQTVKDQEGWLAKFSVSVYRHFKNAALDKLKHVPGAAYDSQDLAKVNACFEGTRMKLLAGIGRWMSDTAGKPIYVLDGIAGIGKSTVAKTVAQRAAAINSLGVSFFFSRDHADRQQASGLVHTIAYQLACCDPSYGKAIATAIDDAPESLHKIMAQQFSTLVADPLYIMLKKRTTPPVFVFDALDECTIRCLRYSISHHHLCF
ncbi:hypothetical protein EST38_g2430 [Candolleomyces aberdarensis]|uniref:Nephrocystin 3-like N-terminal domain-containing protein n=1 Tax=Candolleomyces aberdarensis TaxID=2316362 RepID=A0A4Q2DWQ5_9AGAR|nr:hypothetical protein EST38_g2430 [Candolleomyces aberdarensis]